MLTQRSGVSVVQGEASLLLSAMRRGSRWNGHARTEEEQDPLIVGLHKLQDKLNNTSSLELLEVNEFIQPFCNIVVSDDTTGPITGMAITSLDKFLAYGLIDPTLPSAQAGIENLSEAVTHARFVGTNPASDEVVLMKILQVLHTLMLTPVGRLITNEAACEILQSCFRICFELRLSELLRCFAESTLVDMVQLLFTRLPSFSEEPQGEDDASVDQTLTCEGTGSDDLEEPDQPVESAEEDEDTETEETVKPEPQELELPEAPVSASKHKHGPYGVPCVRELLRFLISIINAQDRHNSEQLMAIGLNLVTVAMECGASHLYQFPSLSSLVQDGLCRNLIHLLHHDSFILFSRALRACFLLFEGARQDLKFQLEVFVTTLIALIAPMVSYDRREVVLECIVQLCHLPHLTAELYVNFDCGLYCSNVFDNLTKALSKNSFPAQQGILLSTHLLSLDALLAIITNFERNHARLSVDRPSQLSQEKRFSAVPGALHLALQEGHCLSNSSTNLDSCGVIFTSNAGRDEQDVQSPNEQKITSPVIHSEPPPTAAVATTGPSVKSPSGYHMGVAMGGGGAERCGPTLPLPSSKELLEVRQRKKLILAGTEQFNKKARQGIVFLQEQGILSPSLQPLEVASFLLEDPWLEKAAIGDYLGDRRNTDILEAFIRQFPLCGVPLVDALRQLLESFRLPGESPVIARIIETFAEHWLACNRGGLSQVFANPDAVYVLSYAIMMLNTDLHSNQVKKKMTLEEFIRNQRKVNNGQDFPREFLSGVYSKIKEEEIIMPSEHTGVVKENYKWKVLLHRSVTSEGTFLVVQTPEFDQDLFLATWGPTVAALSSVFDHSEEKRVVQKAIGGFSKCASVAARYELRDVFDNVIISLCKFSTLLNMPESPSSVFLSLGQSPKIRDIFHLVFSLAHRHGDILREGWKNILDCLLTLFKAKLLPDCLVEVEDFLHPEGRVSLFREEVPAKPSDSSLLSSLYSYWLLSDSQSGTGKTLTPSEIKARKIALKCVKECHPEQLFSESKFLQGEGLRELLKALVFASRGPEAHLTLGTVFDEDSAVFFLELLVSVALENKDRIGLFWGELSNHLSRIILTAHRHRHLMERAVVGLLRLAVRLMSREGMATQLLSSLRVLLTLPPPTQSHLRDIHKQTANGIAELVHSHANTIKSPHDWSILFTVLEYSGSGLSQYGHGTTVTPGHVAMETTPNAMQSHDQEVGVATTSDIPADYASAESCDSADQSDSANVAAAPVAPDWVWVSDVERVQRPVMSSLNRFDLLIKDTLPVHEPHSFFKSCEALAYLVRNEPSVTSANFSSCVHCIRTFTEIGAGPGALEHDKIHMNPPSRGPTSPRLGRKSPPRGAVQQQPQRSEEGGKTESLTYTTASLQLLDLMDTLYSRVGRIFDSTTLARMEKEEGGEMTGGQGAILSPGDADAMTKSSGDQDKPPRPRTSSCGLMWHLAWCPLLQGMARMCCDSRRSVRQTAITYLQRALLAHELQTLSGSEWEACFLEVFFPMLSRLLEDIPTGDWSNLEETRVRASNLLCKVFLQHLPALSQLPLFSDLWLGILDFMDKFLHLQKSDLLYEAIPESLKNMLLVMSTQGIFDITATAVQSDSNITLSKEVSSQLLWEMTWQRIDQFLPNFLRELFPDVTPPPPSSPPHSHSPTPPQGIAAQKPPVADPPPTDAPALRQSPPSGATAVASAPIPVPQSPSRSPEISPQASPPSNSPAPNSHTGSKQSEVGPFPITLHPPLPTPTLPGSHTTVSEQCGKTPEQQQNTKLGPESGQTSLGTAETCSRNIAESGNVPVLIPMPGRASPSGQAGLGTGQTGFKNIPDPVKGPVLIPVAPYAHLQQSQVVEGKQSTVQVSAVYNV